MFDELENVYEKVYPAKKYFSAEWVAHKYMPCLIFNVVDKNEKESECGMDHVSRIIKKNIFTKLYTPNLNTQAKLILLRLGA